jgi:hypothetical protein
MQQAELDHPSRFIGLAHVPAVDPQEAAAELNAVPSNSVFPGSSSLLSSRGNLLMRKAYALFGRRPPTSGSSSSYIPCRGSSAGDT